MAPKKLTAAQLQQLVQEQAAAMEAMQQQMADLKAKDEGDDDIDLNKPSSDEDTSEDGDGVRVKMEAPKQKWTGEEDYQHYKVWRRVVMLWHSLRVEYASDRTLGALLMEAIDGDARTMVLSALDAGNEKFSKVMKVLDLEHGADETCLITEAVSDLRNCVRTGSCTLLEHLKRYKQVRVEALRVGWTPSPATDGVDLLNSCDLSPTNHTNLMVQLQLRGGDKSKPAYSTVLSILKILAKSETMQKQEKKAKKEKSAFVGGAQRPINKKKFVKQPGKGSWKGKGKGKGKGWQGKGAKVDAPCKFFAGGTCIRGEQCRFKHEPVALVGGQGNWLAGDWECPKCKSHNFARNEGCFKTGCDGKKPASQTPTGKGLGKGPGGKSK